MADYVETLNDKFSVEPSSPVDFHHPVPEGLDLRNVFCMEETRIISNDWVVRYKNRFFQIVPQSNLPPAKNKITLQEHLDGSIHMIYSGKEIRFTEIKDRPARPHLSPPRFPHPTFRRHISLLKIIPGEDLIQCTWERKRQPSSNIKKDISKES